MKAEKAPTKLIERREKITVWPSLVINWVFYNIHCVLFGDKGCDSAQLKTVHCSVVVNINVLGCD